MGKVIDLLGMLGFRRKHSDVLNWVNGIREQYGMPLLDELPNGVPGAPYACVIAKALSNHPDIYAEERFRFPDDNNRYVMLTLHRLQHAFINEPPFVVEFVRNFDARQIPELIAA